AGFAGVVFGLLASDARNPWERSPGPGLFAVSTALPILSPAPVVFDDLPVRIDRHEVLRFQGYKTGADVPTAEVLALFDEAVVLGERLMEPRFVYRAVPVDAQSVNRIDAGGERLHIPEIHRLWGRLTAVGAAICTAGGAIERRVGLLFEARGVCPGPVLECAGSAACGGPLAEPRDLV